MGKFHINPQTGNPGTCKATVKCPWGGEDDRKAHYPTKELARLAYEEQQDPNSRTSQAYPTLANYSEEEWSELAKAGFYLHRTSSTNDGQASLLREDTRGVYIAGESNNKHYLDNFSDRALITGNVISLSDAKEGADQLIYNSLLESYAPLFKEADGNPVYLRIPRVKGSSNGLPSEADRKQLQWQRGENRLWLNDAVQDFGADPIQLPEAMSLWQAANRYNFTPGAYGEKLALAKAVYELGRTPEHEYAAFVTLAMQEALEQESRRLTRARARLNNLKREKQEHMTNPPLKGTEEAMAEFQATYQSYLAQEKELARDAKAAQDRCEAVRASYQKLITPPK